MLQREPSAETRAHLLAGFPGLKSSAFRITSDQNPKYNCIAWAVEEDFRWWEPTDLLYWPPAAPRERTLAAYITAYEARGFSIAANDSLEAGFAKLAIYTSTGARDGYPTHAARQLPSGLWTSKLGKDVDIEHTLRGLEGDLYGRVACFMKR